MSNEITAQMILDALEQCRNNFATVVKEREGEAAGEDACYRLDFISERGRCYFYDHEQDEDFSIDDCLTCDALRAAYEVIDERRRKAKEFHERQSLEQRKRKYEELKREFG